MPIKGLVDSCNITITRIHLLITALGYYHLQAIVIEIEQIKLFRSLFHGREDAFAIRWEKGNKSGYIP